MNIITAWLDERIQRVLDMREDNQGKELLMVVQDEIEAAKKSLDKELVRMQRRVEDKLDYKFKKLARAPDIIVRDECTAAIGVEYMLLDLEPKNDMPVFVGGELNLVNLQQGDVAEINCIFRDHKGRRGLLSRQVVTGPPAQPYYLLDPMVAVSGIVITYKALQGSPREMTYVFYKWR